ncbi:MAG: hypothetical protein QOF94_1874, partial [Acidobacteriaceae bacterium]
RKVSKLEEAAPYLRHSKNSGIIVVCSLFHGPGSIPILSLTASLSGLHRNVAQQELNLFQFTPGAVAETSTRPSKVMRREFYNSNRDCVLLDDMPHRLFGHFGAPNRSRPADATKTSARERRSRPR